jgi:hypothetical protein
LAYASPLAIAAIDTEAVHFARQGADITYISLSVDYFPKCAYLSGISKHTLTDEMAGEPLERQLNIKPAEVAWHSS